jgi:hypothetical protein
LSGEGGGAKEEKECRLHGVITFIHRKTEVNMSLRFLNILFAGILCCQVAFAQQHYAVLINGNTPNLQSVIPDEFWNDTILMWKLLQENGIDTNHIFTLFGSGRDMWPDDLRYQPPPGGRVTKYPATMANVQNIFSWLRYGNPSENIPQMTSNDVLIIWTFGHGDWDGVSNAALKVQDGFVWDSDFATYVNPVACQKRVILMQQCHSGGFIDNLQSSKTVMLAVCRLEEVSDKADGYFPDGGDTWENEMGYGGVYYDHGEFDYHVINAIRSKTIVGHPIFPDADNNGGISVLETKTWEFDHDSYYYYWDFYHPMWSDQGSIGQISFINRPMDLAYANKSLSSQSTAFNGQRKLYRESSGKLHEVFASGYPTIGEIFYRNSTDNGTTWLNTIRLSDGTATSLAPCITMGSGTTNVIVTWQQTNGSNYNVVFRRSTNGGTGWGSITTLESNFSSGSPGPLPSVSANTQTGRVVVVYRSSSGLRYVQSPDNMASWTGPTGVPGSPSANHNSPSTAYYANDVNNCNLAFATDLGYSSVIDYCSYSGTWSALTNLSSAVPSYYQQQRNPSVASTTSPAPPLCHVAWEARNM